jgi:hypothetical protein
MMSQSTTTYSSARPIRVLTDVNGLAELLSGARVDDIRIEIADGPARLTVELTRAMLERATTVRHGLIRRTKTPWTQSRLVLPGVRSASIQRIDESAEMPPLLMVEAVGGGYQVVVTSPGGLRVQAMLATLDGTFTDVGPPIESP